MAKATKKAAAKSGPTLDKDGYEVLGGGGSAPMEVGEVVEGAFEGVVRTMPGKKKGAPPVPLYGIGGRTVLGGTVLKQRIEEGRVAVGDYLRILRLEDAPAKRGQNPAKLFDVRVKRK